MYIDVGKISCGVRLLVDVHSFLKLVKTNDIPRTFNAMEKPPAATEIQKLRQWESLMVASYGSWWKTRAADDEAAHKAVCSQHLDYLSFYAEPKLTYIMSDAVKYQDCRCLLKLLELNGLLLDSEITKERDNPNTARAIEVFTFRLHPEFSRFKVKDLIKNNQIKYPDLKEFQPELADWEKEQAKIYGY